MIIVGVPVEAKARAQRINCVSNLKQISTALQEFAKDHDGQFPKEVFLSEHKTISDPDVMTYYRTLLPYNSRKVFVCPSDDRVAAKEEKPLLQSNISYFFAGIPMCNDGKLLSGDRNVVLNRQLVRVEARLQSVKWTEWDFRKRSTETAAT